MRHVVALCLVLAGLSLSGCAGNARDEDRDHATVEIPGASTAISAVPSRPALLAATPASTSTIASPAFEPLPGATAHYGELRGAAFRIEMPARWNGELLLWAHGIHGFGPEVHVQSPPPTLRSELIRQGFAWAASSFSENGFVPGVATNDTLLLKQHFSERFGEPRRTYIAGNSMGGNVVTLALEHFPDEFDGGLSFCGVVAGEEWIDYLLAWATAAEFVTGVELPLDEGPAMVTESVETRVLPALGTADSPTSAGEAFRSVIRNLTGGPRPFFGEGYQALHALNFGLIMGDPQRTLPMTRAASTVDIDFRVDPGLGFDGDVLNRGVRRFSADPALRDPVAHPDTAPTTGHIRDPLLTLHESGDLTVPVSMEQSYRRKAEAAGTADLLVQRVIRSGTHCEFSDEEITRAWNDLVAWVAGAPRPAGDTVAGDLSEIGRQFTSPLRTGDPGTPR